MTTPSALTIPIRPQSGVYATYRRISYKTWAAIAEFVDNSTQNFDLFRQKIADVDGENPTLTIDIVYDPDNRTLTVFDDAHGMDWDELNRAIKLNEPPPDTSGRSEFGMGLKMAACWFGNKWTITTKQLGSDTEYEVTVDVGSLESDNPDHIQVMERKVSDTSLHYTKIHIEQLHPNRTFKGRALPAVREQLTAMYQRDLESGNVVIKWMGEPFKYETREAWIEILPDGEEITWEKSFDFKVRKYPAKAMARIRRPGHGRSAGIHIFRRGRLVLGGPGRGYVPDEIFGSPTDYARQRVRIEVDLDEWPVTQTKDEIDWDGDLEDDFVDELWTHVSEYIRKARNERWEEGKQPTKSDFEVAVDTESSSMSSEELDEAVIIVEESPLPEVEDPKDEVERIAEAVKDEEDPSFVKVGVSGMPTQKVFLIDTAPESEIFLDYSSPSDEEVILVINLNHPFVVNKLERDPDKIALYVSMLFADALVERGIRKKAVPVEPQVYRKLKDQFLRRIGPSM